jgi:general secretion pathway protein D
MKFFFLCLLSFFFFENAKAQFNKYKSPSRFKQPQASVPNSPRLNEANADETEMMVPADAAKIKASQATPPQDIDDSLAAEDDESDEDEDNANQSTFGDRGENQARPPANPKYVNLNPETAFGPEIVESFDFPDTDIMEITRHMQKLTGINLILDKDVKGKVSIIAPTPITVGDAWKAYLTALNMAGYTLVKSGAFYKVINARDIRYTPTKIYTGNYTPDTENYVMRVIALKNVSAGEIARNFRPFMSRYGRIIDIKQTNTVIMADTGSNINRLVKMVKFLDVPGHEETLQIVKVVNSSAQEIAKLLDSILKGGSQNAARPGGAATARFGGGNESSSSAVISRIIAEPRTNSIIAMANAEGARQLKDLIYKLDVKLVSSGSGRVHVYYLNYGDSEELSKTLSSIVSGNVAKDQGGAGAVPRFSGSGSIDNSIFSAEVKITSDKNNNALVVTASPTDWLTLKDVVARLDIPRDQVYVEGLIVEANIKKDNAFGTSFVGAYGQGNAQRAGLGGPDLWNLLGGNPTSLSGFFAGVGAGPTRTIKVGTNEIKVNGVNALIKAVASHENSNVLATPQILALDNTEATFEIGDTVPVRNSSIGQGGVQNFSQTTQEAKLSLKITPQINKVTRFVKLKINQRIDDFKPVDSSVSQAGNGVPTTTRSAITEIMVKDRDTIAMGGLLRDKETVTFSKVPLLGDIPVLGWLFKNKSKSISKVNLLFFMTPKIIAPYNKIASTTGLEVLEKREQALKGIFQGDDKDPNVKKLSALKEKIKKQVDGPLYDEEDARYYENLNNRPVNSDDDVVAPKIDEKSIKADLSAPIEEPNYQEIIKEIE